MTLSWSESIKNFKWWLCQWDCEKRGVMNSLVECGLRAWVEMYCDMKWLYFWWHNNSLCILNNEQYFHSQNRLRKRWNLRGRTDRRPRMTSKYRFRNAPITIRTQCCIPVLRKCDPFSSKHSFVLWNNQLND